MYSAPNFIIKSFSKVFIFILFLAAAISSTSNKAKASVLGFYYLSEQVRLNHLGYTQNILSVEMPWGETCRVSYFHHRGSKAERRTVLIHGFLDRSVTWRQAIVQIPEGSHLRKSLILIDLPHHGDSHCQSVNSFARAELFAKAGIEAIRAKEKFKVDAFWTGSLGGLFGLALLNSYPEAQLSMIVPPLLAEPFAELKVQEILNLSNRDTLRQFLVKVPPADRELPLIGSVVSGLLPRAQFAKQLVQNIDTNRIWQGYLRTTKPVRIMVSQDDLLLPIQEMDPRFTHNHKSVYRVVNKSCGHSILRFCSDEATPFLLNDTAIDHIEVSGI